jgi:hypothetical protein
VKQLEELEKKIVKEAQQAAFAKDIAELEALPQPGLNDKRCLEGLKSA